MRSKTHFAKFFQSKQNSQRDIEITRNVCANKNQLYYIHTEKYSPKSCVVKFHVQFLVCNHVTRRPCWGQNKRIFPRRIYMKIEFSSQRREMLLFLTTNMAAVTSRANQQYRYNQKYNSSFCVQYPSCLLEPCLVFWNTVTILMSAPLFPYNI